MGARVNGKDWLCTARKLVKGVFWVGAGSLTLYAFWNVVDCTGCAGCERAPGVCVAVVVALVGLAGHFVHAFTRNLPEPQDNAVVPQLRTVFVYGYVLQGLALGAGLLLLIGVGTWESDDGGLGGLAYGCQDLGNSYGSELTSCKGERMQWLLHVGGRADGAFGGRREKKLLDEIDLACDNNSDEARNAAIGNAITSFERSAGQGVVSGVGTACRADKDRRELIKEKLLEHGVVSKKDTLRGGLTVPLYVVVLSVMGAAVGMSRRLPEIQRQAAKSMRCKPESISAIVARERVVFQIMQVLAAPLIAVTAFATLEPDTTAAAALIGFTSGFASEAVLVKLRQASEALTQSKDGS